MDRQIYRSWLFVPGDRPERFAKALMSGADAIILDLEDGVAEAQRMAAIQRVNRFLKAQPRGDVSIWVRVDDSMKRRPEIEALANHKSLDGFVIPKVEDAQQCEGWLKPILALIETPRGVINAAQISQRAAASLHGIALGPEDLCAALGTIPCRDSLVYAASAVVFAAHAAGINAYACPGSIGDFEDLIAWQTTLEQGRQIGSHGCLCIHPAQLASAAAVFRPNSGEIQWANAVCIAWDQAQGRGTIAVNGKMIDQPVVARARAVLSKLQ